MNGNYLNKLLQIETLHALYREDGEWYHNLKKFPRVLFDNNGYIVFQNELEYLSHPDLQRRKDLHITGGIRMLEKYKKFTAFERNLIGGIPSSETDSNEETVRVIKTIDIVLRRKNLVSKLKNIYKNTCQICGIQLAVGDKTFYSKAHHIVPLGYPHNGIDKLENMLCVCPNHHVMLDFKALRLDASSFKLLRHEISKDSLSYHNSIVDLRNKVGFS